MIRIKMNVKNLKQIFEQKGAIKPKIQSNQVSATIKKSNVTNELPIDKILEEKIIAPEPKTTTKTTINKSFLQQLNKKLDNKNTSIGSVRVNGLGCLQSPIIISEPKKIQNQLNIEDIITGVGYKKQASESSKARYAINESNPRRPEQKSIFEELGSIETSNDTVSFQELLTKTMKNMKIFSEEIQDIDKNHEPRKTRVAHKYEYAQERLTKEQKLKRIDFVLKVVFADNQYQIIPSNKEQQIKKNKPFRVSQPKIQPIFSSKQAIINNSQILFQNSSPVIVSTTSTIEQRTKSFNNPFLEQLKKIQKKQTKIITNPQQILSNNYHQKQGKQLNADSFTPRQKKKQKKQQNFDDL